MPCLRCGDEISTTHQPCPGCGFMPSHATSREAGTSSAPQPERQASAPPIVPPASALLSSSPLLVESTEGSTALEPETLLQGKQYLLLEQQEMRQWSPELYEALWLAQAMQERQDVIIHEVVLPLSGSPLHQFLRSATNALMASSHLAQMPRLLDVFMEHRRCFFVFEQFVGESLHARIQRAGPLSEQEAIVCYQQLAEALLVLSQHRPAIVHASVTPHHIMNVRSQWVLTEASVLSAGGAAHLLSSATTQRGRVNEECSPRADLSALTSTMYYAVVGGVPPSDGWRQQAHLAQAQLSPAFRTVLLRGIQSSFQQRYHHPSEIIRALGTGADAGQGTSRRERRSQALAGIQAKQHQQPAASTPQPPPVLPQQPLTRESHAREENKVFLPSPFEELPPFPRGHDALWATVWATGFLGCGMVILLVAR